MELLCVCTVFWGVLMAAAMPSNQLRPQRRYSGNGNMMLAAPRGHYTSASASPVIPYLLHHKEPVRIKSKFFRKAYNIGARANYYNTQQTRSRYLPQSTTNPNLNDDRFLLTYLPFILGADHGHEMAELSWEAGPQDLLPLYMASEQEHILPTLAMMSQPRIPHNYDHQILMLTLNDLF